MWAGVIWKRKIVFGKFRHKAAPKNDDIVYLLIGEWNVLKKRLLAYNSHTEAPTVKYVIRSDSLQSAVYFGIDHAHLRQYFLYAKSRKQLN